VDEITRIIERLERQRAAIDRALDALRDVATDTASRPARRSPATKKSRKRRLSPEGRARIAEAARKRWAERRAGQADKKKAPKRASKKTATS
jgi:hypothetical protein